MSTAILGLGLIGEIWLRHLRADGLDVRGWNRTPKPLDGFQPDLAQATAGAELIIIVVSDVTAVEQLAEALLPLLDPGTIVAQCSTITPAAVVALAQRFAQVGVQVLDLPFTGSKPAAESRQTLFFAGGCNTVLDRVRPVLARLSRAILPVGEIGQASALKLALNLNIAQVAQALCESLSMARHAGLSDEIYFDALRQNVSCSGLVALKERKLRDADWEPQFSLKHMLKDLRQAHASRGTVPLPQLERTIEIFQQGVDQGWGEEDFIGILRLLSSS